MIIGSSPACRDLALGGMTIVYEHSIPSTRDGILINACAVISNYIC